MSTEATRRDRLLEAELIGAALQYVAVADWPLTRWSGEGSKLVWRERLDHVFDGFAPGTSVLQRSLPSPGPGRRLEFLEVDQPDRQSALCRTDSPFAVISQTPVQVARHPHVTMSVSTFKDVNIRGHIVMLDERPGRVKDWFESRPITRHEHARDGEAMHAFNRVEAELRRAGGRLLRRLGHRDLVLEQTLRPLGIKRLAGQVKEKAEAV